MSLVFTAAGTAVATGAGILWTRVRAEGGVVTGREDVVVVARIRIVKIDGHEDVGRDIVPILAVIEHHIDIVSGVDVVNHDREGRTERFVRAAVCCQVEHGVLPSVDLDYHVMVSAPHVLPAHQLHRDRVADQIRVGVCRALFADVAVRRTELENVRAHDFGVRPGENVTAQVLDMRATDGIFNKVSGSTTKARANPELDVRLAHRAAEGAQVFDQHVRRRECVFNVEVQGRPWNSRVQPRWCVGARPDIVPNLVDPDFDDRCIERVDHIDGVDDEVQIRRIEEFDVIPGLLEFEYTQLSPDLAYWC